MGDFKEGLASNEKELIYQIKNYFTDFKITEHDIKTPSSALVIEFYKLFLNEFYIDVSGVMQIQMNQVQIVLIDMYVDIVSVLNLTAAVKKFQISGLENFCVTDLINPLPKRTFKHLTHVMRFINFADSRISDLEPKLAKIKVAAAKKQNMLNEIDVQKMYLNKRAKGMADKRAEFNDNIAEKDRLASVIYEMRHEEDELNEKLNSVKIELNKLKSSYEDIKLDYHMLENDICEINRQIKEMKPENPQDPIKSLSTEILEEKAKVLSEKHKDMREALPRKQDMCEQQAKQSEALTSRIGLLKEIYSLINNKIVCESEQEKLLSEIKDSSESYEEIKSSIQQIDLEISKLNEELLGVQLQWAKQELALKEICSAAEMEFYNQQKIIMAQEEEANMINNRINVLQNIIEENESHAAVVFNCCIQKYDEDNKTESEAKETYKYSFQRI